MKSFCYSFAFFVVKLKCIHTLWPMDYRETLQTSGRDH